ncbi:helix-turn-helix domain-containing protein [Bacillus atrophaeus]|uniref:helix-turn-helix domain-containing protein n=1 Tax=Bacillus atrophaeus TaxID=1452 RepID=UPI00227FD850|nr:helix-turn-helix domain-containing protein [Bacillus atrophaeus]MCY8478078.1 helix-turn-helix domain-containing protein [Bacillus atrophaeus]
MDKIIEIANQPISYREKAEKIRAYLADQLIDSSSAAKYVGVSRPTFNIKVKSKEIPSVGDRYLKSDLDRFLSTYDPQKDKIGRRRPSGDKTGFLHQYKSNGQTYVYLKKLVTVPDEGQKQVTIHSFGTLQNALEQLNNFLDNPNEIPSSIKKAGFDQSDMKNWIENLNQENNK